MDEQEAIQRLRRRDIQGLEALVMQDQVQALRVANMIVRDRSQADDIVQGVFIRVYRQIRTYDAARQSGLFYRIRLAFPFRRIVWSMRSRRH